MLVKNYHSYYLSNLYLVDLCNDYLNEFIFIITIINMIYVVNLITLFN